jgi:hypothetical protein
LYLVIRAPGFLGLKPNEHCVFLDPDIGIGNRPWFFYSRRSGIDIEGAKTDSTGISQGTGILSGSRGYNYIMATRILVTILFTSDVWPIRLQWKGNGTITLALIPCIDDDLCTWTTYPMSPLDSHRFDPAIVN